MQLTPHEQLRIKQLIDLHTEASLDAGASVQESCLAWAICIVMCVRATAARPDETPIISLQLIAWANELVEAILRPTSTTH
jgi:hypothetical protein